jgi:receptor protein-tyrosine kinase
VSRVHDALRKAEQLLEAPGANLPGDPLPEDRQRLPAPGEADFGGVPVDEPGLDLAQTAMPVGPAVPAATVTRLSAPSGVTRAETRDLQVDWRNFLARCKTIPFRPAPEAHLINLERPHEVPGEEFRSLRTRLNHMQSQQDLHAIVVTSASPAEGKTFTAINLALAQAQLESPVLIADLDLRRPVVHTMFQCERSPGFSDFLLADKKLEDCVRRIEGTNLYFMPAGTQVRNPLELLNMRQVKYSIDAFRKVFNWVILDTPPLLFSADANLLATLTDGTLIVVRIGSTTYDSVIRAMQSLCENNVLGIVANGARAGELYSKYTYYYTKTEGEEAEIEAPADDQYEDE